ncbi:colanic acid exporter [Roseibium album]|nr:colanic acid exporter [Roseibium album]
MPSLKTRFEKLLNSTLAKSTLTYTVNFGLQLFIQLGYFILVSRYLGPHSYGLFITVSAINAFANFLIGLGSDQLMIQRVAVNRDQFPRYFGHAVILAASVFPFAALLTLAVCYAMVGEEMALQSLLVLTASNIIFARINTFCANVFMAFDRPRMQLWVNVFLSASRALFLIAAILVHQDEITLEIWIWWFFAASALSASQAVVLVIVTSGLPVFTLIKEDIVLGFQYCLESLATAGVADMDKPTVTAAISPELAGIYGAAFKIVNAASAPVRALLYATYTRHFKNAAINSATTIQFGKSLIPYALGLGGTVAFSLIAFADIIPMLIGEEYQRSVDIVRVLSLFPLLMGLSGIAADTLRAIGKQKVRITLLTSTALLMIPVVYYGAVWDGIFGAALGRIALQILLVACCWFAVAHYVKKEDGAKDSKES